MKDSYNAYNTFYNIPVKFDLNTGQEIEYDLYEDFLYLKWQMMTDTTLPDSTAITALFDIEEYYNTTPGVLARNILIGLGELDYEEPVFVPDFNKSATVNLPSGPENNEKQDKLMKLSTDPAGAYFTVEYNLDGYLEKCIIEVFNINGVGMKSIELQHEKDQVVIVTSDYSPGIYVVQMVVNGEIIEAQKLVLIK